MNGIVGVALVVLLFWGVPKLYELIRDRIHSRNIKWCVNSSIDNLRILLYIKSKSIDEIYISERYRISSEDAPNINHILNEFQIDLKEKFFGKMQQNFKKTEISYLLHLRNFLLENQNNLTIEDKIFYELQEERSSDGVLWSYKYKITDFGITYYKVLLLLQVWYSNYKKNINRYALDISELKENIYNGFIITHSW